MNRLIILVNMGGQSPPEINTEKNVNLPNPFLCIIIDYTTREQLLFNNPRHNMLDVLNRSTLTVILLGIVVISVSPRVV